MHITAAARIPYSVEQAAECTLRTHLSGSMQGGSCTCASIQTCLSHALQAMHVRAEHLVVLETGLLQQSTLFMPSDMPTSAAASQPLGVTHGCKAV